MGPRKRSRNAVHEEDIDQAPTSPKLARVQEELPRRRTNSQGSSLDKEYGNGGNLAQVAVSMGEPSEGSKTAATTSKEPSLGTSGDGVPHGEYTKCHEDQTTLVSNVPKEVVTAPPTVS
jgi:hypothetical protein